MLNSPKFVKLNALLIFSTSKVGGARYEFIDADRIICQRHFFIIRFMSDGRKTWSFHRSICATVHK
ncbi:hypothetical protein JW998_06150 [candidate division KSB1 bacterium]|nr:hypothetical protein [candidate division KSB1 bacterium]